MSKENISEPTNQPSIYLPDELDLSIGGYGGPNYHVKIIDGLLYYSDSFFHSLEQMKWIAPTPEQWQKFRSQLDKLDVWNWENFYLCEDVLDGASWEVIIKYNDRQAHSSGSNGYPGSDGPNYSREFRH